nr:uncharacterized protein LOC109754103 [Aegilops tauschii subsp. strangulata]
MEDEADTAAEEKEFAEWAGSAGETSGASVGAPLVEDVVEESAEEETEADDPPAPGRKHVLRWASTGEPVRSSRTTQRQQAQTQPGPRRGSRPQRSDTQTLAQRARREPRPQRATSPPAGTPHTPLLVESSPDNSPRRSPRFSPKREFITRHSLTGIGARILDADLAGLAGGEGQQEEPLKATSDTLPPSTTPPRGVSQARAPSAEPKRTEEEEAISDPPSTDQEDIDIVIQEVARDADVEAAKIAAGETAKSAAEEAAKGLAGETGEAAAGEAGTASARAPAEGEVFDDEALATAGLQVIDEPSASGGGSQEEQFLWAMSANFQKLQALHRARRDKVNSRMAAVDKAEADFEERIAQTQVWFGEAREELRAAQGELDERKRDLILKQEEDLVAREQVLAAMLRGKEEEIGKIVAQRTQELEQRHKDTLDALALDNAGKVVKLELEREELKKEVSELTEERDTANHTLADSQVTVSDQIKMLSEANSSIDDLKLQLGALEGMLSELRSNRADDLANESRRLCRGALTKVLTKVAFWNPSLDFANALESLPEDTDLAALEERIEPIISCVDGVERVEGQRRD